MSSREIHTPASAVDQDDDTSNSVICKFCRRQFAKYTCPTCNVSYCSLTCFRSPSHSQCSETFYRNELKSDIATTPSRTTEERRQMIDLLKRFEEEAVADQDALEKEGLGESDSGGESRGKEEESLVDRFAGLDINALSSEDMWEMLTPAERERFMRVLEDPTSDLTQRLLGSEQLEVELERPWWTEDEPEEEQEGDHKTAKPWPEPIPIPQSMVKPIPHGHPLVYNLCAVCVAYSYIIRHLGVRMLSTLSPTNPDLREALRLIDLLVPFLSDRRSTTLHPSVGAAATDVYSRFEMGKVSSELLAVLLEDTAMLMKPRRVIEVPSQSFTHGDTASFDTSTHALITPIRVLSDLIGLCQSGKSEGAKLTFKYPSRGGQAQSPPEVQSNKPVTKLEQTKKRCVYQHVVRKLEFYIAHVSATPSEIMEGISEEVVRWSKKVRAEGQGVVSSFSGRVERAQERQQSLVEETGVVLTRDLSNPWQVAAASTVFHTNILDHANSFVARADEEPSCGTSGGQDSMLHLRIASVFVILVSSTAGALFPVLAKRSSWLHMPKSIFDFAKYFGSGVIIATAFIHLLAPALEALNSPCLSEGWHNYPYAFALCLLSIFSIFIVELIAFRWGTAKLAKLGKHHDAHGHRHGGHAAHGPEGDLIDPKQKQKDETRSNSDVESAGLDNVSHTQDHHEDHRNGNVFTDKAITQIIGVAILEFGVALHSVLIGLTLAADEKFKILFIVLVFHQTFEGLGIGSRLAYMRLPASHGWVPYAGAILFGLTTPTGIAIGLGIRGLYNPGSPTASIVSGVLDSLSSGILIYTGLVELLAHEFLFNKEMMEGSTAKLAYALGSMGLGCGLMALLGRWA